MALSTEGCLNVCFFLSAVVELNRFVGFTAELVGGDNTLFEIHVRRHSSGLILSLKLGSFISRTIHTMHVTYLLVFAHLRSTSYVLDDRRARYRDCSNVLMKNLRQLRISRCVLCATIAIFECNETEFDS
jgi:hypothetical protein